ncbi:hypothetical protein DFP93_11040 [Aneurinibacillus soli]|uniref:Uncharacterized protein n=2 Tax=Aneurinibacillus soli TaxID=1500254 RepID=A0A0U4WBY0_9BACL|nr:hypothetical protein DFP93_11040 [Aneurinibacillus soli]BAU26331.1 hypothetical protein CB4_00445 [Aneurinibacillus soli]
MQKTNRQLTSKTKIDVLIPVIEKDLKVLPFVIDGVRKNVKHPIENILIVAPPSEKIKKLCRQKRCKFINENSVLPITKKDIKYRTNKWDRSGWLFQQLLKLSGDSLCSQKFYLVIDADTVLIRPHRFRQNQKTVFYCRNWSRAEYFRTYKKLMGKRATAPTYFVAHYMLFEKSKVKKLKRTIAAKHNTSWYSAIIRSINKSKQITFSEFETYGNFIYANYPGQFVIKKTLNRSLQRNVTNLTRLNTSRLAKKYRSISLHARKWYFKRSQTIKKHR